MQPTLLILAAGMASRYGSMKQTEGFGPSGETIMDYSIYDAISAGFGKVVFIIRKDFADNFKANFDAKLKGKIAVDYVYQEMSSFVNEADVPADRTKPWGTGHAILCAKDAVKEPFAVINADDYYGRDAFVKAAAFLNNECNEHTYAIIGYQLDKTLSEHGTVSRGVCAVDANNNLVSINERTKIYKNEDRKVVYDDNNTLVEVPGNSSVSMNFWCFHPSVFTKTEELFRKFVPENKENIKAEFFIPIIADEFIKESGNNIKVIPTTAQWFGVTYKEDAPSVKKSIDDLIAGNVYPASLWK
ncbi:MAG: nucleotidyltransferase [Bacteroidetes bacterium]|nr:nucleotidyltransferase [Bacteroidota bacterium]